MHSRDFRQPRIKVSDTILMQVQTKRVATVDCVQAAAKLCIQDEATEVQFVEFWYAQKNGKWVLNTAYLSGPDSSVYACKKIPRAKEQEKTCNMLTCL